MPAFRRAASVASFGCLALSTACAGGAASMSALSSSKAQSYGPRVEEGVARVRAATASFVSLDSAVASGYVRDVSVCYNHPRHGAMGFHHINRAYVDATVDVQHPEILLYERRDDGRYALNGVEFIVPYRFWPRDSIPPKLLGLQMKQQDELKLWYLHMWVWTENSAGLFADYNPGVKCPPGGQTAQLRDSTSAR